MTPDELAERIEDLMQEAWQLGMVNTWAALRTAHELAEDEASAIEGTANPVHVDFIIGPIQEQR